MQNLFNSNAAEQEVRRKRMSKRLHAPVILAGGWLALLAFIAVFGGFIAPRDYQAMDLMARLQSPIFSGGGFEHLLGTDELGRDTFSRLVVSIRLSLAIAFSATIISAVVGTVLGFAAAHFRGWIEQVILTLIDFQLSMPFIVLAMALLAFFGNSLTLFTVLLGFLGWERTARIARGLALAANHHGYTDAVRQLGASSLRVYSKHVLPNIAGNLIVSLTVNFPEIILMEASLSFLGLGVQPPLTSLGSMVGFGREYLQTAPWILLAPSAVIVLTTFSVGCIGDHARDKIDPESRNA